ncbi:MAG: hypothetical protein WAW41_07520 [Methylobacter sp.]
MGYPLKAEHAQGLTVRPDPSAMLRTKGLVEGWTGKPIMVRQAHHERLNLKLSRLNWVAEKWNADGAE